MYRKDYIIKQFEAFGKVLALLISRRKQNDLEAYEKSFAELTMTYAGKSPNDLRNLSEAEWSILLSDSDLVMRKITAALLFELFLQSKDNTPEQQQLANRCLQLYQNIQDDLSSGEFDLDVHYKLQFLKTQFS